MLHSDRGCDKLIVSDSDSCLSPLPSWGYPLRDDAIARWADLLVDYCLRVERDETIVVAAELEARPLVEAASKAVVLRGAHPVVRLEIPGL